MVRGEIPVECEEESDEDLFPDAGTSDQDNRVTSDHNTSQEEGSSECSQELSNTEWSFSSEEESFD
jgi:hypothetical protein